jgi:hypothetical protein
MLGLVKVWCERLLAAKRWLWLVVPAVVAAALAMRRRPVPIPADKPEQWGSPIADDVARDAQADAAALEASSIAKERSGAEAALGIRNGSQAQTEAALKDYLRRVRSKGAALVLLLGFIAAPQLARADYAMAHPITHEPGWWVPDDGLKSLLADAAELVEVRASLADARASKLKLGVALDAAEVRAQLDGERAKALRIEVANLNAELTKSRAWYRSPRFLVPLGVVLGTGLSAWIAIEVAR